MTCFHPIPAWQTEGGDVVFVERGRIARSFSVPCGRCIGCRLARSKEWAVRCMHEAQMHKASCFITLTYNDEHVSTSLDYRDFQLFMKRLRKTHGPVRFFMSGEYGEQFSRPHFHACLFGIDFSHDRLLFKRSGSGENIFTSKSLESLWPYGFSSVGDVTFESAAYIARYVVKKVSGPPAEAHYTSFDIRTGEIVQKTPEFGRMSLRPGLGMAWIRRYYDDVISQGAVVVNGSRMKIPKYYMDFLSTVAPFDVCEIENDSIHYALKHEDESTDARLTTREAVARARVTFKKRTLE